MPEWLSLILWKYQSEIWFAVISLIGSAVRLAVAKAEGEHLPFGLVLATYASGMCLSSLANTGFQEVLGIGPNASTACAFIIGVMGMTIVKHFIKWSFPTGGPK